MRLTPEQAQTIRQHISSHLGSHARVWLFGSRVDDSRRGGDVDLYVEPKEPADLVARLRCKSALVDALDLNVDLVVQQPGRDLPIYRIAKQHGVPLRPNSCSSFESSCGTWRACASTWAFRSSRSKTFCPCEHFSSTANGAP